MGYDPGSTYFNKAETTVTGEIIKMYPTKGGTLASGITVSRGRVAFGEGLS